MLGSAGQSGCACCTVVPPHAWQSTLPVSSRVGDWALFTCTVAPGFEHDDFTTAGTAELSERFPQRAAELRAWEKIL
jgi:predicted cupin superfamily sugar epimerase